MPSTCQHLIHKFMGIVYSRFSSSILKIRARAQMIISLLINQQRGERENNNKENERICLKRFKGKIKSVVWDPYKQERDFVLTINSKNITKAPVLS